jgi:tRNA threonylcarbamoyladenosine biosynthesis protein TsaB
MQTLLAIECSSHVNAVAYLADLDRPHEWMGETCRDDVKASAWLLPAIDRVLSKSGARHSDVQIVAFGAGPGSFTGVRTACATAQALAYGWGASLVAVDCLEALAEASELARVDVLLDARMNELYTASFARSAHGELVRLSATALLRVDAFSAGDHASPLGSGLRVVAAAVASAARAQGDVLSATDAAEARWAYGVARVAINKLKRHELTDPQYAEPIYVRNHVALTEAERAANALSPRAS